MLDYTSHLLALAWQFPNAARYLWRAHKEFNAWLASLSPDVRGRLIRGKDAAIDVASAACRTTHSLYSHFMAFPQRTPTEWQQPSGLILSPLAHLILFFQPVSSEWEGDLPKDGKILFVANQSAWALDMPALHSVIYLKTGKLVRFTVDPIHFKLPFWKHLLEYMGAVPLFSSTCPELMESGFMMAWFPEGIQDPSDGCEELLECEGFVDKLDVDSPVDTEFASYALDKGYAVVPISNIGMSEMMPVRYKLSLDTVYRVSSLLSRFVPSSLKPFSSKSSSANAPSIPIVFPTSYQRQYMRFATPIRTDGPFRKLLETECAMSLRTVDRERCPSRRKARSSITISTAQLAATLGSRTITTIEMNRLYLREIRAEDPRRYVFQPIYNAANRIGWCIAGVERKMQGGGKLVRKHSARALRVVAGWVDVDDENASKPSNDNKATFFDHDACKIRAVMDGETSEEWYECD